jgi:hypothetical protein
MPQTTSRKKVCTIDCALLSLDWAVASDADAPKKEPLFMPMQGIELGSA